MFFRRKKPRIVTFDDRLARLREAGFAIDGPEAGTVRVSKHGCVALIEDRGTEHPVIGAPGVVAGNEVANLVHGGYQQFFVTPTGRSLPALAPQLQALHNFQEDLKEALGLTTLYNQALGTVSSRHLYDRLKGRDTGASPAPRL